MEFRIISLPPFKAASSGVAKDVDFSAAFPAESVLEKFDAYFSKIVPSPRDSFLPRDFLYWDSEKKGMIWMWALAPDMDDGGHEIIDFDGGYYVTYAYKDGDQKTNGRLYKEALKFIEESDVLELDVRADHYPMGHIITPHDLIKPLGWAQMETFIPVKLKAK